MSDETKLPPTRCHPEGPTPPAISSWFAQSPRNEPFYRPYVSSMAVHLERRRTHLFPSIKATEDQFLPPPTSPFSHVTVVTAQEGLFPCIFQFAGCHLSYGNKFDWKQHVLREHIHDHQLCHGPPCSAHPRVEQQPTQPTQCHSLGSRSGELPENLIGVGSKSPPHVLSDQPDEYPFCAGCDLPQSLGCPAQGCGARFHGIAAWSLRLDHIAIHLGETRLLFGGAEDTEFVHWASHSSVKIIAPVSSGSGWLLRTARKFFGIPSDSGYGSSLQAGSARPDDIASRLEPSEDSGSESSDSDVSTATPTMQGIGDGPNDTTDMTTALSHLGFGSTPLPIQESIAPTDFFDIQDERSMSESVTSHESVDSDQSVDTMDAFQFHMRTLLGVIDDFISNYREWLFSQIDKLANAPEESQNLLHTGSVGECHYVFASGSGSSPSSDQANSNSTSLLPHIPGGGNRGNGDDDDESPNQNLYSRIHQSHLSDPKEFACPFYKRDHKNREWRDCSTKRFLQFSRLLEHIKRTHRLNKLQCERCLSQLDNEHAYNVHVDSTIKCEILNHGKIGQGTYGVLSSRSLYRGMDPEKRWIQTYCLLFPSESTVPSPYYEDRCHYTLSWDDGYVLDHIRSRFPSETESTIQQLHSVLQYPQAENLIMDEYIRKTGEATEDLNRSRPSQPHNNIAEPEIHEPEILNQDNFHLSHSYHWALSCEETSSMKGLDYGQWDPDSGKHPNRTGDGPRNICASWSSQPENAFLDADIFETCDTYLSSLSMRGFDYEFSEQHQNLNHEFTLHQLEMAVQNE